MKSEKEIIDILLKSCNCPDFFLSYILLKYFDSGNIYKKTFEDYKILLDFEKTLKNIAKEFNGILVSEPMNLVFLDGRIIRSFADKIVQYSVGEVEDIDISKCLVERKQQKKLRTFEYVIHSMGGFEGKAMEVAEFNTDLVLNYNDDVPYKQMEDFITKNNAKLSILYGIPGTGKTSFLRHLISNVEANYIYLDPSMFNYLADDSFLEYLMSKKHAVIILEDCENIIQQGAVRDSRLSKLLNLSDGILGDALSIKFICTFNANLRNIDQALLRKGRLHTKYEFKNLTADKVQALGKHLGIKLPNKEMPLCDIYNFEHEQGEVKENRKIGF